MMPYRKCLFFISVILHILLFPTETSRSLSEQLSFLLAKLSSYWVYFLFPHRSFCICIATVCSRNLGCLGFIQPRFLFTLSQGLSYPDTSPVPHHSYILTFTKQNSPQVLYKDNKIQTRTSNSSATGQLVSRPDSVI